MHLAFPLGATPCVPCQVFFPAARAPKIPAGPRLPSLQPNQLFSNPLNLKQGQPQHSSDSSTLRGISGPLSCHLLTSGLCILRGGDRERVARNQPAPGYNQGSRVDPRLPPPCLSFTDWIKAPFRLLYLGLITMTLQPRMETGELSCFISKQP